MTEPSLGGSVVPCRKILCVGLNYREHAIEAGLDIPSSPVLFGKWPTSLIGNGEPIRLPYASNAVDYEGELALIIGRSGRDISEADAIDFIGGVACFNDVTARDLQQLDGQWSRSKSFDSFGPISPIVPRDRVPDLQKLSIRTFVNDSLLQCSNTADMIFSIRELVAFASVGTTLEVGDIIATGTPAGVGSSQAPPRFLRDGDVVSVEISEVGRLNNPVTAYAS